MSETKFTPGPWVVTPEHVSDQGDYQEPAVHGSTQANGIMPTICTVRIGLRGTEANATLIAAAPEMFDACSKLVAEVSGLIGNYEPMLSEMIGNTNAAVLHLRVIEARAALKKAEGGQ